MAKSVEENKERWAEILEVMDTLRAQCPWDQKQTIHSLNPLTMEEVYELSESLRAEDWTGIREELGDLLLHIIFYAKIADEEGKFDIADVVESLRDKLIYRHPHIYADTEVQDENQVKENWEKLKKKEKKDTGTLDGVPTALPSIIRAYRMQEKAAAVGFDWPTEDEVLDKVQEELQEIKAAVTPEEKMEEFGDLLFTLVNYARKSGIPPEEALQYANNKFKNRFTSLENIVKSNQKEMDQLSLEELEKIWQDVKNG